MEGSCHHQNLGHAMVPEKFCTPYPAALLIDDCSPAALLPTVWISGALSNTPWSQLPCMTSAAGWGRQLAWGCNLSQVAQLGWRVVGTCEAAQICVAVQHSKELHICRPHPETMQPQQAQVALWLFEGCATRRKSCARCTPCHTTQPSLCSPSYPHGLAAPPQPATHSFPAVMKADMQDRKEYLPGPWQARVSPGLPMGQGARRCLQGILASWNTCWARKIGFLLHHCVLLFKSFHMTPQTPQSDTGWPV